MTGIVSAIIEYFGHPDLERPYLVCIQGLTGDKDLEVSGQYKTLEEAKAAIPDLVKKFVAEFEEKVESCKALSFWVNKDLVQEVIEL